MVVGFLKGIWGKPTQPATGLQGIWGTVTRVPESIFGAILTPFKILKWVIVAIVVLLIYNRFKK